MNIPSYYIAASYAAEIARNVTQADALLGRDDDLRAQCDARALKALTDTADALGYVVMAKADHLALTGFVEEVRDFRPTIFRSHVADQRDEMDDLMPLGEFQAFQIDAQDLVGKKAKVAA